MLQIFEHGIKVGVENKPIFKQLMPYAPKSVVKTQIMCDMETLFIALINEYSVSELADMIDKTLHDAIKEKDNVKVEHIEHDTDNT